MALDSNVSPKTLQSIPEVDAAKCRLPEKNPLDMSLQREQDDAAIVYAAMDINKASEVVTYMRSLKVITGESPRISLYDMEKFEGSLIEAPAKLLESCRIIFILLTVNFEHDKHCIYVLHETLADTRLERNSSDPKKYCVRPLHTQPENRRKYKTPCGLKSIRGFDVHDLDNEHCRKKLLHLFNFNRGHRETGHCHDQQEDLSKFCKEDKSDLGLAETSLVNDYATMGPSSSSPHTRAMTNGFSPPHKDIRRQGNGMTLRDETSDGDFSDGSYSMEARHGSRSLKPGEYSCINEPLEHLTRKIQYEAPFVNTESNQRLNLSDSMGSLTMDGKRSGFDKGIETIADSHNTGDPVDGAVDDPAQTHVTRGSPSVDEPDHSENSTDKRHNHPKTGADIVPVEPCVCSPSREPGENVIDTSNAPKPDKEITGTSLPVDSEDFEPVDSSVSTNFTDMAKEVQQSTFTETHDQKIQRCSHLGSASPFQKEDSAHDLGSNKDGQLLSALVDASDITKGTDRKLEVEETSKEFPSDSYSANITDKQGDAITEPVMKTCGPGYQPAPLCSYPSSEDRSLFEPQRIKGDDNNTLKTPTQEEVMENRTLHADDVPVSPNQIVPAGQSGGTPSSATYVFINDCSNIELSGDVHLVNVNTKTEGSNMGRENRQPKTKKRHGSLALMPRNHETSSGSTCSSKSSPSSSLEKSSTEMLSKTQAASVCKVAPQSGLGRSKGDAQEGSRCLSDVIEDARGQPVVESSGKKKKNQISDSCSAQNGSEVDCADKLNLSKDERKKKSKRKIICFPFPRCGNKKK
ncbi:uncharacterized protein LOC124276540 isoform X2 [Haliotis rubra]|uniref:uncharacterized protein LOC124276540 isoform X2 n=1 Tax=Haliotis rubra TaxID=36100 RepID=UPI001EE5D4EE|nr:uncharacterized protein LOC124276540 isoform X2 [Haliotis rubra]